jgi:putative membrane protein
MATANFFLPRAKELVTQAIKDIEKQTSAEIVVAVRRRSGNYRHTDLYAGAAFALVLLVVLLFDRREYAIEWMPLEVAVAFAFGAFWVASVDMVRRALTPRRLMHDNVRTTARAAFYDMGIARTRGRSGILVFVSMFERKVEVVCDVGIKPPALGAEWSAAVARLEASLVGRPDFERFIEALRAMAQPLARELPHQPDDIDELPDEPVMS